jgi:hypothetical protein
MELLTNSDGSLRQKSTLKVAELLDVDPAWAIERREEYLLDRGAEHIERIWHETDLYEDYKARDRTIEVILTGEEIQKALKKLRGVMEEIRFLRGNFKPGEITPDMIGQAKLFPFEQLHHFDRGRSACPLHGGKNPMSFAIVKGNKARCHSCGWYGDTIKFVQETEGLTFQEAVRRLT